MCCCEKPNVNGQPGYSWDGKSAGVHPANPPALKEGDTLVYDEPGRCGGLDCHSHHFRVVKGEHGSRHYLLVRHGGGDERIELVSSWGCLVGAMGRAEVDHLAPLDSNGRYWLLHTIYSVHRDAARTARQRTAAEWMQAAATKRIKTRKTRGYHSVRVWIEPPNEATPKLGFSAGRP